MRKKILFLGAAPAQIPAIKYALSEGHYVITCDNRPNNPGHKLAHEKYEVSTTDLPNVLALAKSLGIDGIVGYASDPAAPTAAYVAEVMGLPGNPYQSVLTLCRKDLFRAFLKKHNFNVPKTASFKECWQAKAYAEDLGLPIFVKPVDSSGSKGITRVNNMSHFKDAFKHALNYSREKIVVIEQEIVRQSFQIAGDGFIRDGKIAFKCWADEHFNEECNGLVPIGQTFPTTHSEDKLDVLQAETNRLLRLLEMRIGAINFDVVFDTSGRLFFLELGPRNGGCSIPEVIYYATGVNLIKYTVRSAIGDPCDGLVQRPPCGYWSSYMVHSPESGKFNGLSLSDWIRSKVVEKKMYVSLGDFVSEYTGSDCTLGAMIMKFDSSEEMTHFMENIDAHVSVVRSE